MPEPLHTALNRAHNDTSASKPLFVLVRSRQVKQMNDPSNPVRQEPLFDQFDIHILARSIPSE